MNNKEKLDNWYKDIKNYEKLNLREIKELKTFIDNCNDSKLKKELREKLINGTLYYIYNFFNNSYILNMNYDIDDLINSFVVEWIKILDSDNIMKVIGVKKYFEDFIGTRVYNNVIGNSDINLYKNITKDNYTDIISYYFNNRLNNKDIKYNEFREYCLNKNVKSLYVDKEYIISQLYIIFNKIYEDIVNNNEDLDKEEIINKILIYKDYILNYTYGLCDDINYLEEGEYNTILNIEKEDFNKYLNNIIFNSNYFKNKEKTILYYRYGFDGKRHTELELGNMFGVSHQRIEQIERKLKQKRLGTLTKLKGDYYD